VSLSSFSLAGKTHVLLLDDKSAYIDYSMALSLDASSPVLWYERSCCSCRLELLTTALKDITTAAQVVCKKRSCFIRTHFCNKDKFNSERFPLIEVPPPLIVSLFQCSPVPFGPLLYVNRSLIPPTASITTSRPSFFQSWEGWMKLPR